MYNSFIHEQKLNRLKNIEQQHIKEINRQKRYHTQVQPFLLQHYDKRINSFIHNVGERPILINPQNLVIPNQQKTKNLVFRNGEDWRSFYNLRERQQIKKHRSFVSHQSTKQSNKIMPTMPTLYQSPHRVEYRSRNKQKQINPPMKYNSILHKQINQYLKNSKNKKDSLREFIHAQRNKQKERKMSGIQYNFGTTHNSSSTSRYHDQDENDFLKHDKTENIQIEARMYEKQREIVQKKLHFKKLIDLSIKNPYENNRKDYKRILQRCGLLKMKRNSLKSETAELDKFTYLVETTEKLK